MGRGTAILAKMDLKITFQKKGLKLRGTSLSNSNKERREIREKVSATFVSNIFFAPAVCQNRLLMCQVLQQGHILVRLQFPYTFLI